MSTPRRPDQFRRVRDVDRRLDAFMRREHHTNVRVDPTQTLAVTGLTGTYSASTNSNGDLEWDSDDMTWVAGSGMGETSGMLYPTTESYGACHLTVIASGTLLVTTALEWIGELGGTQVMQGFGTAARAAGGYAVASCARDLPLSSTAGFSFACGLYGASGVQSISVSASFVFRSFPTYS